MSIAIGNWAGALWLQQHSFSNFFWDTLYFPSIVHAVSCDDCQHYVFAGALQTPARKEKLRREAGSALTGGKHLGTVVYWNILTLNHIAWDRKANVSTFSILISWVLTLFTSQGHWGGGLPKRLLWTRTTQSRGSNWDRAMLLLLEQILVRIKQFTICKRHRTFLHLILLFVWSIQLQWINVGFFKHSKKPIWHCS